LIERSDNWQLYAAGGIAVVTGLILVLSGKKKIAV
jgi:low affinity Fe/Cu permease